MLLFSAASEPVEMLVATVQQKVYQCVEAVSLSLVSVQMHESPRIFGCALLAAYTVAPRQSSPVA